MAQATFSIRMDEGLKREFDALCSSFGMNSTTAFNIFAKAVVRERKIPFEISAPEMEITREKAIKAFRELRAEAHRKFPDGMTMEEIDEEIRKVRYGIKDDEDEEDGDE